MRAEELESHYYLPFAAAYVRGSTSLDPGSTLADPELVRSALAAGIRLGRFKRSALLPRVARVIGFLRGVEPKSLIDLGPGRGAFLWPLLDAFPELPIHGIDLLPHRVALLEAVSRGGVPRLSAELGDICEEWGKPKSVAIVTALEVIEHLTRPERAIARALEVATDFVVASVPSKPDDNPEHVNYFAARELEEKFRAAGATKITTEHIPNHRIVIAKT